MSRWILKLSSCNACIRAIQVLYSTNAGMETSAPLINAIVNNALYFMHSNSRIKQLPPQIIHILRFLW